ncbi:MAG: cytochrome c oxidase assembly factor 1 family protein [Planctomycetota bacterium]|nr:cytochrome c oxidase assembly factor 1 family protein [Planctomycetota bacterium]
MTQQAVSRPVPPGLLARHGWLLPVGCAALLLLSAGGCFGVLSAIFYSMKSSTPYQSALKQIKADPRVRAKLGAPIEAAWSVSGNIQVSNTSGSAALDFGISGPQGQGSAIVRATRANGAWTIDELRVDCADGSPPLYLVGAPPPASVPGGIGGSGKTLPAEAPPVPRDEAAQPGG